MKLPRPIGAIYVVSGVGHAVLGLLVARVDAPPKPDPPPIEITVVEEEPEPPPPPPPKQTPEPEPEDEPIEAPKPKPVAPPPKPAPKAAKAPAAKDAPASSDDGGGFDSGLSMSNAGVGVGGPAGAGGGGDAKADAQPERKVVKKSRAIAQPKAQPSCAEPASKPKPLSMPEPEYTAAARASGIEGKVRLSVTIAADGSVQKVTVIESLDPDLDAAAKKAVLAAKFEPAVQCGAPTSATFKISVKFTL